MNTLHRAVALVVDVALFIIVLPLAIYLGVACTTGSAENGEDEA
jgi:hypothetical protein